MLAAGSYQSKKHGSLMLENIQRHGGCGVLQSGDQLAHSLDILRHTTHVLAADGACRDSVVEKLLADLPSDLADRQQLARRLGSSQVKCVRAGWLQQCLKTRQLHDTMPYEITAGLLPTSPDRHRASAAAAAAPSATFSSSSAKTDFKSEPETVTPHQLARTPSLVPKLSVSASILPGFTMTPATAAGAATYDLNAQTEAAVSRAVRRAMAQHPELYWPYCCYNCGSQQHGARTCPHPLRGTAENRYVPPIKGAPRHVAEEFVCSDAHRLDSAPHPNAEMIRVFEELQASYSNFTKDKVRSRWWRRLLGCAPLFFQFRTLDWTTEHGNARAGDAEDYNSAAQNTDQDHRRGAAGGRLRYWTERHGQSRRGAGQRHLAATQGLRHARAARSAAL